MLTALFSVLLPLSARCDTRPTNVCGTVTDPDGTVRLLHASSKEGRVTVDPLPLAEYIRRNRTEGLRVFRIAE